MTETQIHEIVTAQREYFYTGATLDIDFRINALKKLNGFKRAYTHVETHTLLRERKACTDSTRTVPFQKLQETIPLRCDSHHEPMELPIHAHDRASDRRYCSW